MAISRPFLLALLGAALLGATFLAVQNARTGSPSEGTPAVQSQPAKPAAQPAPSKADGLSVEDALAAAFASDQKVDSGRFSFRLSAQGFRGVPELKGAFVAVAGRFQGQGSDQMPKFDIDLEIAAARERMKVGAVSLGERGFVTRGERAYAVPKSVMDGLAGARREIAGYAKEPQPKLTVGGFDVGGWLTAPKVAGTETIDGVEATHIEATLDTSRFVDGLGQLGQGSSLPEGEFLDQAGKNRALIQRVLGRPEVDVYVGQDRILRRLTITADLNLGALGAQAQGAKGGRVVLDARLSDVNEPQRISGPDAWKTTGLRRDFGRVDAINAANMMGVGALMIQQPGLAGARANNFSFDGLTGGSVSLSDNPRRAARAVKAGKKVLLVFHNPKGLDDRMVIRAARSVGASTKTVVLTDDVAAVKSYGKLLEDLGVSQTPSVVLIDSTGDARLLEGYVDTNTLTQAVADAR